MLYPTVEGSCCLVRSRVQLSPSSSILSIVINSRRRLSVSSFQNLKLYNFLLLYIIQLITKVRSQTRSSKIPGYLLF
jgi:hypothetical protein